jgi:hypothetical protein
LQAESQIQKEIEQSIKEEKSNIDGGSIRVGREEEPSNIENA